MVSRLWNKLLGVLKRHSATARLSCDGTIMEYTHDEYCDLLSPLVARNGRAGTDAGEYVVCDPERRHRDDDVFRQLEQRCRRTGIVTRTSLMNAVYRRVVRTLTNEYAIIAIFGYQLMKRALH